MHHQPVAVALLLSACSPAVPEPRDAGPDVGWIAVTPANVAGYGVPMHYVRMVTGKHVEVWVDPALVEMPK